jgi:hypothetical protein
MADGRVLQDFLGQWRVVRRIMPATGPDARFEGRAVWHPDAEGALYREDGHLLMPGQPPMQARREYRWAADLSVYFPDGRFFHQVPSEGGETVHWCDPDTYHVRYDFSDWPVFCAIWTVSGPRKDYRSETTYARE